MFLLSINYPSDMDLQSHEQLVSKQLQWRANYLWMLAAGQVLVMVVVSNLGQVKKRVGSWPTIGRIEHQYLDG